MAVKQTCRLPQELTREKSAVHPAGAEPAKIAVTIVKGFRFVDPMRSGARCRAGQNSRATCALDGAKGQLATQLVTGCEKCVAVLAHTVQVDPRWGGAATCSAL